MKISMTKAAACTLGAVLTLGMGSASAQEGAA